MKAVTKPDGRLGRKTDCKKKTERGKKEREIERGRWGEKEMGRKRVEAGGGKKALHTEKRVPARE